MKLPPFALHRPESVGQASRLLADLGDEGAAYCGGTELLLAMKLGLASYEHLVDLKRVDALRGITQRCPIGRDPDRRRVHPPRDRDLRRAARPPTRSCAR